MDSGSIDKDISSINSTITPPTNQEVSKEDDGKKGRHFAYVVYPESAPADWIEQLKSTGLAFVVSPLHDKDENPDGTPKKAHYHVIVSWGNTTTFRSARGLCDTLKCPRPERLVNPTGMYRYLTHRDNPEKYQYKEMPVTYNGWQRPLDNNQITELKSEIWNLVYTRDCQEYSDLVSACMRLGPEYFEVVSNHTMFFKAVCDGYRHNPVRCLMRRYKDLEGDDEKTEEARIIISDLIETYTGECWPEDKPETAPAAEEPEFEAEEDEFEDEGEDLLLERKVNIWPYGQKGED